MPGSPLEVDTADVICSDSCDSTQRENPSSYDFETDDDISTEQGGDDSGIFLLEQYNALGMA